MADKILYTNKEELIDDESIPLKNKVTADDLNEIKEVVNSHADDIETLDNQKADRTEIPIDLSELSNENTKFVNETQLQNAVNEEKTQRENADNDLQGQINNRYTKTEIDNKFDVTNGNIATLQVDSAHRIELSINQTNYVMTATLKNKAGTVLNQSSIDLPLESVVVNGRYDNVSKKIILTLQNGNTIEIPVGDLISGLQSEITPQNKLSSDLVDDTNHTNKFVTQAEKNQIVTNKTDIADLDENKENISNKVTELTEESTDIQYPSAKAVYDSESVLKEKLDRYKNTIETELGDSTDTGTDLTLNGTAEFDVDLGFSGNTSQETTEGYQLFDKDNATVKSMNASASVGSTSTYSSASNQKHVFIQCKPNTTYTVQKDVSDVAVLGIYESEQEPAVGVTYKTLYFSSTSSGKGIVTTGENVNYLDLRLNTNAITSEVLQKILDSILIYEGSDTKPYEKYTGKQPAPNSEYPQTVQVVKGSNEIKIQNKNLFVAEWVKAYLTGSGVLYYSSDGHSSLGTVNYIKVKPNTQYRLSYALGSLVTTVSNRFVSEYDKDYNHIQRKSQVTTFTTGANTEYIRVSWYKFSNSGTVVETDNNNPDLYVKEIQLELGGTATNYIEHKEQTYPITLPTGMFMAKIETYEDKIQGNIDNWYIPNKILKIDSYNGETITTPYISTTGGLDIGATVYYVGTETLSITDSTLITQLNNIKEAYTYQEQTNISQTNEDLPFIITADFKLSNLSRIEALESALETVSSRVDLLEE